MMPGHMGQMMRGPRNGMVPPNNLTKTVLQNNTSGLYAISSLISAIAATGSNTIPLADTDPAILDNHNPTIWSETSVPVMKTAINKLYDYNLDLYNNRTMFDETSNCAGANPSYTSTCPAADSVRAIQYSLASPMQLTTIQVNSSSHQLRSRCMAISSSSHVSSAIRPTRQLC